MVGAFDVDLGSGTAPNRVHGLRLQDLGNGGDHLRQDAAPPDHLVPGHLPDDDAPARRGGTSA